MSTAGTETAGDGKPLRIVMLIAGYRPAAEGGTEKQCRQLSAQLAARGHSVQVLTRWPRIAGTPRREVQDGVSIRRLGIGHPFSTFVRGLRRAKSAPPVFQALESSGAKVSSVSPSGARTRPPPGKFSATAPLVWLEYLFFQAALFVWFLRHRAACDVLHVHETHWLAGYAVWLGRVFGKLVVVKEATFPVFMPAEVPAPGRRRWERLRTGAFYFAQTGAAASALAAAGVDAGKISVVPNGVRIPDAAASPAGSREVLYVGNLHQGADWKGFDVLFGAWAQVAFASPGARLNVVGAGDAEPWKKFLAERGVAESVKFCGAVQELSPWFARSALLVLPSRREGMPNAVLEAQAWGLPVVVSDLPGCRAVVQPGRTGLVVPVGDADQLAAAIVQLLDSPARRAGMGTAARAWAAEQFSFSRVTSAVEVCYRQRLHEENGTGRERA